MQGNTTADRSVPERTLVTAAEWFAGGSRIPYDPRSARIPDEPDTSAHPGTQARMYGRGYRPSLGERAELREAITRRHGAAFLHDAAGFVGEHRRNARRWDLAAIADGLGGTVAITVAGSVEDPYEHRQIEATRQRVPEAEVLTFPGGHLTTTEHPDLLAAAVHDLAARHGVGGPATDHR